MGYKVPLTPRFNIAKKLYHRKPVLSSKISSKPAAKIEEKQPSAKEKALSLTEVRKILAEKSRAGFTAEIKELLVKHGADKLSKIAPTEYAALVADVEVLGNE